MVGLGVGIFAVLVIYILLIALAKAAARGDRLGEEWLQEFRKRETR